MQRRTWILVGGLLLLLLSAGAQSAVFRQPVTLDYQGDRLGTVIDDISQQYAVRFTYSSEVVPLQQKIFLKTSSKPLEAALADLFTPLNLDFKTLENHVFLKRSAEPNQLTDLKPTPLPPSVPQQSPLYPEEDTYRPPKLWVRHSPALQRRRYDRLPGGERSSVPTRIAEYEMPAPQPVASNPTPLPDQYNRLAQVSLLPYLGTNARESDRTINQYSLNIFWGQNGGVSGVEIGGFFNSIIWDVEGVQIAGLGNMVGGSTTGTQLGTLFNITRDTLRGTQVAGLFNVSGPSVAVQTSGLFNIASGDLAGVQAAGLFNRSGGDLNGVQAALLFNSAKGDAKFQASSLFNIAQDIGIAQTSLFFNAARKVNGFQFGLINVSDTVSGASIGVLNIVKHGYNRVELYGSENFFTNFSLKLGGYHFYNILYLGGRWDDAAKYPGESADPEGWLLSWSLGYGLGTAFLLSERSLLNLEVVSMHINEAEQWTSAKNQLHQFRLAFDYRLGRRTSVFFGPTLNYLVSERIDPETGLAGSKIPLYTMWEERTADRSRYLWVGINTGFRF